MLKKLTLEYISISSSVLNNILLKATPENVVIHEYLNAVIFEGIIRNKYKLFFEEILAVRNFFLYILAYTYTAEVY
jgi:hypothetical protein